MENSNLEYRKLDEVYFLGVKINNVSFDDVHEFIRDRIQKNEKGYICANDVCNVIGASQDKQFLQAVNLSSLNIADGTPLTWYARLVGCREIERISGMDMMARMFAANNGYSHFLLGDTQERIDRVIEKARGINETIRISGYSPPFKEFDEEDNRMILERLNKQAPDIIWVSFGGEKQEMWMFNNLNKLNRGVMIGVGAAFKFLIGELKTPPRILQKMGLQWVYRTVQVNLKDPKKHLKTTNKFLKRRLIFISHFLGEVLRSRKEYRKRTGG
jgi:N-acetylglucosaminyldiphosphoundecaprenol N-acetyl-beta-D-mannosaminyltransferase